MPSFPNCNLLTRIGNLDLDHSPLEGLPIKGQGLFKSFGIGKLDISKTLGTLHFAILDDADTNNLTAVEEFGDRLGSRVVRQIAKVSREGRLLGKLLGNILTDRVT